jgi:putative ABC transport system substrate-binding protein
LAELARQYRLPSMFGWREYPKVGGLMSYGPNLTDMFRRCAVYVDKILKGAKPADLPVEQASRYEFVINLDAARALDVEIPPSILIRADEVIE